MAEEPGSREQIPENPLVAGLRAEGTTDAITFRGYIGPSTVEGKVILYPSLNDISESFEFAREDVLQFAAAPESLLPLGATIIWVKKDAKVIHHRVETVTHLKETRVGRLRMRLPRRHPRSEARPVCQSQCGVCQSACDSQTCRSVCEPACNAV